MVKLVQLDHLVKDRAVTDRRIVCSTNAKIAPGDLLADETLSQEPVVTGNLPQPSNHDSTRAAGKKQFSMETRRQSAKFLP